MTATTVYARYNCGNTWPVAGWTGVTSGDGVASTCSLWNNSGSKVTISPAPSTFPNDVLADHLWPTSAQNPLTLTIPVSGYSTCTVVMGFAEIYNFSPTQTGSRVFDISINGSLVQDNYDVYDAVGAMNKEAILTFEDVAVVGGNVTLTFTRQVAASMISGVIILVDDPPSVSITSPSDAATVSGTVTIEATATDDDAVSDVEFFIDDVSIGSDSTPSGSTYSISWDTTGESDGSHTIKAVATDSGAQTDEDSISVTVSNTVPTEPGEVAPAYWGGWSFEVDTGAGFVAMETGGDSDLWDTVEINRGLQGVGYKDRVARIGVLTCALDNRGQKYSPGHANALAGFDVEAACRFKVYYDGTWYTCFTGVLDEVSPAYGAWGERLTRVRAVDDMDRFDRADVGEQVIRAFWRTGEGIEELVDNVYTPSAKTIDTGQSQLDYIGFQSRDSVRSAITKLVNSEGFPAAFYTTGDGTVVFEDRNARRTITETAWTLTGPDMAGLDVRRQRRDLYNLVQVTVHPSTTSPGFEVVGSLSTSSVPMIAPAETRSFTINYRDPDDPLTKQFFATNVQDLVNGTDIIIKDAESGGNDLYASCTVTHVKGANSSKVTITNNSIWNAYLQKLDPRGQGVRMYEDQTFEEDAAASVEAVLKLDAGFNADTNEAIAMAERVARRAETAKGKVTDIYVKPRNPTLLRLIIGGEISDRVSLNEGQTATDDLVLINALRQSFRAGGYAEAHFETEPETDNRPWLLGVVGRSELGTTTYLG